MNHFIIFGTVLLFGSAWANDIDRCSLPVEVGVGRAAFQRWAFDSSRGQCRKFYFGGIGGNENNFHTLSDCQAACGSAGSSRLVVSEPTIEIDVCDQPMETGLCMAYFERWWFNAKTQSCEQFIYGGCQGNENRFATEKQCLQRCGHRIAKANNRMNDDGKLPSRCLERPFKNGNDDGLSCMAYIPSWSYVASSNSCERFVYGGCGGNQNRFESAKECQAICGQ